MGSIEDKEKGEVGIMVRDLSNQPNRSADYSSQNDKSRIELAEELEEINTTEKQKIKEFEILEVTDEDTELVHEEGNNEPIIEILLPEKTLTDNDIENERVKLDCNKKK